MKRLLSIAAVILLVGVIASPLMAQSPGGGKGGSRIYGGRGYYEYGPRGAYNDLTTGQRDQLDALHKKFYDETSQLRRDLRDKRIDLHDLLDTENPDIEKAKAIQSEISTIQGNMAQKRVEFMVEKQKIAPDARFGFGRGFGHRLGFARNWGGYGPGSCWR